MADNPSNDKRIERECRVFTIYLVGQEPDGFIRGKYAAAFDPGQRLNGVTETVFDRLLGRLAIIHPLITQGIDSYARVFFPQSLVRKKLVLVLAVLETWGPTAARIDCIDDASRTGLVLRILARMIASGLLLVLTTLTLGPVHLMLGARVRGRAYRGIAQWRN